MCHRSCTDSIPLPNQQRSFRLTEQAGVFAAELIGRCRGCNLAILSQRLGIYAAVAVEPNQAGRSVFREGDNLPVSLHGDVWKIGHKDSVRRTGRPGSGRRRIRVERPRLVENLAANAEGLVKGSVGVQSVFSAERCAASKQYLAVRL